ncbi:MAG TPA: ABC transporter ATP-binding protein [Solirubrobacteraceae bacterium]|nr:ABC transporter ATP-binding protein [Solirubrobacteraceae bacterium]
MPAEGAPQGEDALLRVRELIVEYGQPPALLRAVDRVSLELRAGRALGLVGESGAGKSTLALALPALLDPGQARVRGRIELEGRDLLQARERELQQLRGARIGVVFQEALSALHPLKRIGAQVAEALRAHRPLSRRQARERAQALLAEVGLDEADALYARYPHELSGGMRQRVLIAIALAGEPRLLIADEPTSSLDLTVQMEILRLLGGLRAQRRMALLLISHDLRVVAALCDEVAVMYAGRVIERASARELLRAPEHPYTAALLAAMPTPIRDRAGARSWVSALQAIPGEGPDMRSPPPGCRFHPRCPYAFAPCSEREPPLAALPGRSGHLAACHLEPARRAELFHGPAAA